MYWQNGQNSMALLPRFNRCGRPDKQVTGGRGRGPAYGTKTYQLTEADIAYFEEALKKHYWADGRATLKDTFELLLQERYFFLDGNKRSILLDAGQRPSYRQLQYYVKTNYTAEQRLRARKGNKDFELQDRSVLGTVLDDCMGVGHYYEADATIADVYLVASDDRQTIIGKPTVYLIVDRASRLIVGLYVGLENPSWVCAKQAVLFISEDKPALCARYGVEYVKTDWPADMVQPQNYLVDLGEWNSKGGEQLSKKLGINVAFVPARRADWKPIVESKHKQTRTTLQYGTPGFDPPENAKRRQGKHYEHDACLTLKEFTKLMLELVIKYNRMPLRDYPLSMAELDSAFVPSPINLWNRDIGKRSGVLARYSYDHLKMQLLTSDSASVTEHGIEFRGCLYTSRTAIDRSWFVQARKERFAVQVSFDPRLVDNIYVHDPNGSGEPMLCDLISRIHQGRSFAEVEMYLRLEGNLKPTVDQLRLQASADYRAATAPTVRGARAALDDAQQGKKKSRSARKADTKPAREKELAKERADTGSLKPAQPAAANLPSAEVLDLGAHRTMHSTQAGGAVPPVTLPSATLPTTRAPLTIAERARLALEKLKGQS
jgi:putative transposase